MLPTSLSKLIAFALLVAGCAATVESADCGFNALSYTGEKEKYIVILKEDSADAHFNWLKKCVQKTTKHISGGINAQSEKPNFVSDFTVKGAITGYTTYFDAKFVKEQLSTRSDSLIIEKDAPVKINYAVPRQVTLQTVQNKPTPNLDRIDQADFPLDGKYTFPTSAGSNVVVFVVDTGVLISHAEFQGRATAGGAFCPGCPNTDDNGHGSHVAGIIAGKTFGVAKNAKIVGVKVLDAQGAGSNSNVISGLTSVLTTHQKNPGQLSVVNLSLGGSKSAAVNKAVKSLTDAGVHVVVAAGNESADSCGTSPASEPSVITVGALEDKSDDITDFSNVGKCVDIFAPGRDILSVGIKSNTNTQTFSGTSQASPHVAGVVALVLADNKDTTPAEMATKLLGLATKGKISNASGGSPNAILRVPSQ